MKFARSAFWTFSVPPKSPVVLLGYISAIVALIAGTQLYLVGSLNIDVFSTIVGLVLSSATFVINLTGWTLYGFIPIGGFVTLRAAQAASSGGLPHHHVKQLYLAMEFALALGMAGTIWAFIQVGKNYAASGSGDPHTSFMSILMGFGSTFFGLIILMATLAMIFWFPQSGDRSARRSSSKRRHP